MRYRETPDLVEETYAHNLLACFKLRLYHINYNISAAEPEISKWLITEPAAGQQPGLESSTSHVHNQHFCI